MVLKGNDAFNKANKMFETLEVSQKKDSFSNVEKVIPTYNGKTYGIVKEGAKFYIKESIKKNPTSSEDFIYIDGVQNKHKYAKNTIVEAEKTLNLWNIEFGRVYGKNTLGEQKTVLSIPKETSPEPEMSSEVPAQDVSAEVPSDAPVEAPVADTEEEIPVDDMEGSEEGLDDSEELDDPVKMIQKLAGKLAYELREFSGEDEKYGDSVNFALGMVAAAVNPSKLSEKDIKSLKKKVGKALETHEEDQELDLDVPTEEPIEDNSDEMNTNSDETSSEDSTETSDETEMSPEKLAESLSGKPIGDWIKDFTNSKDAKFKGKSKKERKEMAIGAFYGDKKKDKKSMKESYDSDGLYGLDEDDDMYFPEEENDTKLLLGSELNEDDSFEDEYSDEETPGQLIDFVIPTWAVSALINSDYSGLEDREIEKLDKFVEEIQSRYGNANFMLGEKSDESWFSHRNDIDGRLGADVTELYIKPSSDESMEDDYIFEIKAKSLKKKLK